MSHWTSIWTVLLTVRMSAGLSICVLHSPSTPFNITTVLSLIEYPREILTPVLVTNKEDLTSIQQEIVLDYMYTSQGTAWARELFPKEHYIPMWKNALKSRYIKDFSDYVASLNLSRVLLLGDTFNDNIELVTRLYSNYSSFTDKLTLPEDLSLNYAHRLIGELIKPQGFTTLALFLSPQATVYILQALEDKHMNTPGYVYVLSQESNRYRYITRNSTGLMGNGLLIVGEDEDMEESVERLEAQRIRREIESIQRNDPYQATYSLLNTQSNTIIKLASRPSDLSLITSILLPGNATRLPSTGQPVITASVNYRLPVSNPLMSSHFQTVMRGFQIAFEEINTRHDILPHFHLQDNNVSLTSIPFDRNYSLNRVITETRNSLGLIYMPPSVTSIVTGMTQVFLDLNLTMPISTSDIGSSLSDPTQYPLFIRPNGSLRYLITVICHIIRHFGWTKVAFIYSEDDIGKDAYELFLSLKDAFDIAILNPESTRPLPAVLTPANLPQVRSSLQAIIHSMTRIILIVHVHYFLLLEELYDLGVREEYVMLYATGLNQEVFQGERGYKRRVVSKGALQFAHRLFVGGVGERVKQKLVETDGKSMYPNSCLQYDAAYLYFHALHQLLYAGKDYSDPGTLLTAMRHTRFHGCSGFVYIQTDSNDRPNTEIVITNFQYNLEKDEFEWKEVGSHSTLSVKQYHFTSPIQWPDDRPSYSDVKLMYFDCGVLVSEVVDNPIGKMIALIVHLALSFYVVMIVFVVWKKRWRRTIPILKDKQHLAFGDLVAFITMLIDCFQLAFEGPDLSRLSPSTESFFAVLSLHFHISVTDGVFWGLLTTTLGVIFLWMCLWTINSLGLCMHRMHSIQLFLGLLLASSLYLPVLSLTTEIFECFQGRSRDVTASFLNKDCHQFCWTGKHLGYAVWTAVTLLLFIPLAIYSRPSWQETTVNSHIRSNPLSLMSKSAMKILLLAGSCVIKGDYPALHAYLYISLMFVYLLFCTWVRQFNYERLNLWQVLVTLGLLSVSTAAHIAYVLGHSQYLLLAVSLECVFLLLLGLFLQTYNPRFESKLIRHDNLSLRDLFLFSLLSGHKAATHLQRYNRINSSRKPSDFEISPVDINIQFQ